MKIKILIVFYVILTGTSCIDDTVQNDFSCEKEGRFLGDFPLTASTDSLLPYVAGKSLIFVDSLGNEITFAEQEAINETIEERTARTVCGRAWLNVHEFDFYIEHQKKARYYSNEINARLNISASKSYFEITDTSFTPYDYFIISVDWSYMQLGYMDDGSDISSLAPYLTESFVTESIGDTTFLGRDFNNVLMTKFEVNPIFYSKTTGLVAFRSHDNVFWVFDRTE